MKVVMLMGPTAAGKTALGIRLAKEFDGEIINADSRQVYVGMDIGTDKVGSRKMSNARPASADIGNWKLEIGNYRDRPVLVEGVPHFLLDLLTPDESYSAAQFRDDARRIMTGIHRRGKLPIVVGGTGFYIRALTGEQELPNVPPDAAFRAWAAQQPVEALAEELKRLSPELYGKVDNLKNRRRVTRYLEVARCREPNRKLSTFNFPHSAPAGATRGRPHFPPRATRGRPHSAPAGAMWGRPHSAPAGAMWGRQLSTRILKIALVPPRDVLRERIAERVTDMFRRGFVAEVRGLVAQHGADAPGLQTTGYREIMRGLRDGATEEEMKAAVLRAHRETARRQLTWLKRESGLVTVTDPPAAHQAVRTFLSAE